MLYVIRDTLVEIEHQTGPLPLPEDSPYVAVLTPDEWMQHRASFDLGIDIGIDPADAIDVQAEVNYDSITGIIRIPDRSDFSAEGEKFAFALDEKGVVFIDAGDTAAGMVNKIEQSRRWRNPSLERFLYDFLNLLVEDDPAWMARVERELDSIEKAIYKDDPAGSDSERVNRIRSDMRDLDDYFEHLQDFADVMEENENGFFKEENLRYFRLFFNRVDKLRDKTQSLREQAMQMRDLYKMHLDIRQNRIMAVLTIVTAIFAPLTLIVGWYGMNFTYMPELEMPFAYPLVGAFCLAITIGLVVFFRRIKWL